MRISRVIAMGRSHLGAAMTAAMLVVGGVAPLAMAAQQLAPGPVATLAVAPVCDVVEPVPQPGDEADEETTERAEADEDAVAQDNAEEHPTPAGEETTEPVEPSNPDKCAEPATTGEPVECAKPGVSLEVEPAETVECAEHGEPGVDEVVVVVLPEVRPVVIDGQPGYLLPQYDGVSWMVNGTPIDDLVAAGRARLVPGDESSDPPTGARYEVTPRTLGLSLDGVVIAAIAAPGYLVAGEGGEPAGVHYAVDLRTPVEAVGPSATDGEGRDDVVTVHDVAGQVVRDVGGDVLAPGEHPVAAEYVDGAATVALTVVAAAGYRLDVDGRPVEATPGAGGVWALSLVFTDVAASVKDQDTGHEPPAEGHEPPPEDQDQEAPADEPPTEGQEPATEDEDSPTEDIGPEVDDVEEHGSGPDGEPSTHEPLAIPLVTIGDAPETPALNESETETAPDGESDTVPDAAPAAQDPQRPDDPGRERLNLLVLLGIAFLGGAWLILGAGRDMFG